MRRRCDPSESKPTLRGKPPRDLSSDITTTLDPTPTGSAATNPDRLDVFGLTLNVPVPQPWPDRTTEVTPFGEMTKRVISSEVNYPGGLSASKKIVDKQDAVDASAFVHAPTTCLEAVEMQIGKESQAQFIWRIENASKNSPLQATLVGDASKSQVPFTPAKVAQTLIEGLDMLATETIDSAGMSFGNHVLQAITRFSKLSPKGVSVRFQGFGHSVSITRETIWNARKVMQARELPSAKFEDFGTVEGVLSTLFGKGDQVQFSLEESLTGQTIPCYFPKELIPEVQPEWRNRVCVSGMIRRSIHDGAITSIAVEKITRKQEGNIDWAKIPALNLTDGVESSAYVRRIRDEE